MMSDVQQRIHSMVTDNKVLLFMKGTPDAPQCGFSARSSALLKETGVPFAAYNVLVDPEIREGIKAYGNWPTIPQLYVNGELIGGCDVITELFQSGELKDVLKDEKA
jgi:monothiol glutaredoxin